MTYDIICCLLLFVCQRPVHLWSLFTARIFTPCDLLSNQEIPILVLPHYFPIVMVFLSYTWLTHSVNDWEQYSDFTLGFLNLHIDSIQEPCGTTFIVIFVYFCYMESGIIFTALDNHIVAIEHLCYVGGGYILQQCNVKASSKLLSSLCIVFFGCFHQVLVYA